MDLAVHLRGGGRGGSVGAGAPSKNGGGAVPRGGLGGLGGMGGAGGKKHGLAGLVPAERREMFFEGMLVLCIGGKHAVPMGGDADRGKVFSG